MINHLENDKYNLNTFILLYFEIIKNKYKQQNINNLSIINSRP